MNKHLSEIAIRLVYVITGAIMFLFLTKTLQINTYVALGVVLVFCTSALKGFEST